MVTRKQLFTAITEDLRAIGIDATLYCPAMRKTPRIIIKHKGGEMVVFYTAGVLRLNSLGKHNQRHPSWEMELANPNSIGKLIKEIERNYER